jgi:hypothetical protein
MLKAFVIAATLGLVTVPSRVGLTDTGQAQPVTDAEPAADPLACSSCECRCMRTLSNCAVSCLSDEKSCNASCEEEYAPDTESRKNCLWRCNTKSNKCGTACFEAHKVCKKWCQPEDDQPEDD